MQIADLAELKSLMQHLDVFANGPRAKLATSLQLRVPADLVNDVDLQRTYPYRARAMDQTLAALMAEGWSRSYSRWLPNLG